MSSRRLSNRDHRKPVTIQDVADRAGVSIATVSRVLNGVNTVDTALADRVRAACAALKYQPNRAARILSGARSATIGLLVTDVQNPFFMEVSRGVEDVAYRNGYLMVLCNSAEDSYRERQYIDVLCSEPVAGAIVVPTRGDKNQLEPFKKHGIPVVTIDRRVGDRSIDAVLIDNVSAAHEAVTHLIYNGYRRIGLITGPRGTTTADDRLEGYRRALQDAGIMNDPDLERRGPFTQESGQRLAGDLLDLAPPVDAIVTGNNRLTLGAMEAIHARGLRAPHDVAVVGFDDMPWTSPGSISLTTVMQPSYELGRTAALRLIQRLRQSGTLTRQEIILAHHLQIGDSSHPRAKTAAAASR